MSRTMFRAGLVACFGVALAGVADEEAIAKRVASPGAEAPSVEQRASSLAASVSSPRAVLDKYCVVCHNTPLKTAGLALDTLDVEHVGASAEVWEKVVKKLRAGAMPPGGRPRPDKTTYDGLIATLEIALDRAAAAAPNPGRPAIHRLNRAEYVNVIRDLLGLDVDGASLLPADDAGYGFDNIAAALTVSPALLERYLLAAKKISRLALADATMRPTVTTYNVPFTLMQDDRMSEDLPFGSRGGIAIRHYFPVDGEYAITIRMQRNTLNIGNEIRGLDVKNEVDVRLDGAQLQLFTIGGDRSFASRTYTATEDAGLHVRFPAKAGARTVGMTFRQDRWYVEGVGMSRLPPASDGYASGLKTERDYGKIQMGVDEIDITGPFDAVAPEQTPSRQRILVCRPTSTEDEEPCAKTILTTLGRRAYRRPVTEAEVVTLLEFYKIGRREGGFEAGIEKALIRLLTDPEFLFRAERDPVAVAPGAPYRISDLELASRLSFFLWSSIPDDPLLDLAAAGRLKNPAVLEQQVRRMLADPRAKALVSNFFGQWLYVRNMATHRPDPKTFPEFDENLRDAFQRESELFLESQLREDRPVTDLLTADYTFANERLARHYGIPQVYGSRFRRVTLSDDRRAGVLGHGSILTVTSYANRTSPVVRGKWLLETILGTPPPPPPADVPPLDNTPVQGSLRQRMEQHRTNPVCASCHAQIDPLGFALENFDAIGKWRTTESKTRIDASGSLVDGTRFDGPVTFRQALLSHRDVFMHTLAEKLLTYALGRGVEYYDMPAVRRILRETAAGDDRWSALILAITKSMPFQMRRAES